MAAKKGKSRRIDTFFMERSAEEIVTILKEHGIRASYQRQSRSIDEEPFVEHTFDVIVTYVHIDEWHCAIRILKSRSV